MQLDFEQIAALCEDKDLFGRVVSKGTYTPQEAALIGAAYLQIFKRQIRQTCGNCVGDALAELVALYRKNPNQMKDQNQCHYKLRAGMLIRLKFGDNVFYSNANLTDKVAEAYILAKPSRLSDFEKYPESITKKIEAGNAAPAEPEPETDGAPKATTGRTTRTTRAKGTTAKKTTTGKTGGRGRKTAKDKAAESAATAEAPAPETAPAEPAPETETQPEAGETQE